MTILYDETIRLFELRTENTQYQMKVDDIGYLRHIYYGRKTGSTDNSYVTRLFDLGFSANPYELRNDRTVSPDVLPFEYASQGNGDFRVPAAVIRNYDGSISSDFRYESFEIINGKYSLPGLPSVYDNGEEGMTLIITLRDRVSSLLLRLYYGVFENRDVITRAAEFINEGTERVVLEKADSVCLDFPFGRWNLIHFHGRHLLERQPERITIPHLVTSIGSNRGTSSHQHNPFVILCDEDATEDGGACYGMMLVYSGGFLAEIERTQTDQVRMVMGIHPGNFSWKLDPGESFTAPEVILSCAEGLTALSHNYHDIIRHNICRGGYKLKRRPVLINSWEAVYFDIEAERIVSLAKEAADLGIELFVLDDGWFQGRRDDNAGLGDWFEDRTKLPDGLSDLITKITDLGMKFGIWIEPEMVNEDSNLYRAYPEWALRIPGRDPVMGRNQLVLDMSRREVVDYLFCVFSELLEKYDISYVKWDMNRNITDVYSHALPADRQGEVLHRCVLGVYDLLDRLVSAFPNVLFEGCAGGGGRFDAGMLYYTPQIWCSDDTDPIERLLIQKGTTFGYPVSTISAHVSASPNHQTGRTTSLRTRSVVAMGGTFGYEIDLTKLSEKEKEEIREEITAFKLDEEVHRDGFYYRLDGKEEKPYSAWMSVSRDGGRAIVSVVQKEAMLCPPRIHLVLKGLNPEEMYRIAEEDRICSGASLMYAGYTFDELLGDYPAVQLHLTRI